MSEGATTNCPENNFLDWSAASGPSFFPAFANPSRRVSNSRSYLLPEEQVVKRLSVLATPPFYRFGVDSGPAPGIAPSSLIRPLNATRLLRAK